MHAGIDRLMAENSPSMHYTSGDLVVEEVSQEERNANDACYDLHGALLEASPGWGFDYHGLVVAASPMRHKKHRPQGKDLSGHQVGSDNKYLRQRTPQGLNHRSDDIEEVPAL